MGDRDKEIARLRKLLAELQSIPAHRREDECADVRDATVRTMLRELGVTASGNEMQDDLAYLYRDFIAALKEKDAELYRKLSQLSPSEFWREWKQVYPEDFPQGGMSPPARSSVTPKTDYGSP